MIIKLSINCSTAAFDEEPFQELKRILDTVPRKVKAQLLRSAACVCDAPEADDKLQDVNGNTVGTLAVVAEEEPHEFVGDEADCDCRLCGEGRMHYLHNELEG